MKLQTYNPEDAMTVQEIENYRALKDPILRLSPEAAAITVRQEAGNNVRQLKQQVERLTKIVVALNAKIK